MVSPNQLELTFGSKGPLPFTVVNAQVQVEMEDFLCTEEFV